MGLDIYLQKMTGGVSLEEADRIEADYESRSHDNWVAVGGYENATEEQREAVFAQNDALAKSMGLVEHGKHPARLDPDVPASKVDPDHLFRLDYLRSSYYSSGINRVLVNAGVADLYDIFGRTEDDPYHWRPDWAAALERLDDAIEAYKAHLSGPGGNVRVMEVRPNVFMELAEMPSSEADAMKIYRAEAGRDEPSPFLSYGTRNGDFYLNGMTVRAFIPGVTKGLFSGRLEPIMYVVCDAEVAEGKEDWHLRALKITREMIEFVLAQPDRDAYYVTWSA